MDSYIRPAMCTTVALKWIFTNNMIIQYSLTVSDLQVSTDKKKAHRQFLSPPLLILPSYCISYILKCVYSCN